MCGCNSQHSTCHGLEVQLWSKKKKKEVLQHKLECLEAQRNEIRESLDELTKE